jgi:hypothetical protein
VIDEHSEIAFRNEFAQAFIHWQFVESELFKIFSYLVASSQGGALTAAFHAVINFNSKVAMTDAAGQFLLPLRPLLLLEWNSLRNKLQRLAKRRNQIAHFQIVYETLGDADIQTPILQPRPTPAIDTSQRIDEKRLAQWKSSFLALAITMYDFVVKLNASGLTAKPRELPSSPYKYPRLRGGQQETPT